MNPHSTPAKHLKLMVKNFSEPAANLDNYRDRDINKAWEDENLPLFQMIPPTKGSIINIECAFRVDFIEYAGGKIVLWVSKV
jgi:hypothetical protein